MVDTRLLSGVEVLVAVIETGSFVRAAEALDLSDFGHEPRCRAAGDAAWRATA